MTAAVLAVTLDVDGGGSGGGGAMLGDDVPTAVPQSVARWLDSMTAQYNDVHRRLLAVTQSLAREARKSASLALDLEMASKSAAAAAAKDSTAVVPYPY